MYYNLIGFRARLDHWNWITETALKDCDFVHADFDDAEVAGDEIVDDVSNDLIVDCD